jgi:uncharacterized repeat protein (TIGR01451 family)
MNNFLNKIKILILTGIIISGILLPFVIAKAATFNTNPSDITFRVANATKNPGCTTCWSSSVYADAGDRISFRILYNNTSNETATQTRVRLNLPTGSAAYFNVSGDLWAQNASTTSGVASVYLSSSQSLSLVSGDNSVIWYSNNQTVNTQPLLYGQTGSEVLTSSGLDIGDIPAENWGYVVIRVQVSGAPGPAASAPTVFTNAATNISQTSATFNGSVNPNGAYTNAWFEYGTSQSLGATVGTQSIGSGATAVNITYSLSNLLSNTTYYYRAVASNSYGASYGTIQSFVTSPGGGGGLYAPIVTTLTATNISSSAAALNASVNPNNSNTNLWFEYGTTPSLGYTSGYQGVGSGNWNINVTAYLSNLSANTTYYYRAVASNSYGASYGTIQSFVTSQTITPQPSGNVPIVITSAATYVYGNSALLNGSVNPNSALTNAWFEWGTTTGLGKTTTFQAMGSGNTLFNYSYALSGLVSGATYYFRAVAQNPYGITYGNILRFTTLGGVVYQPAPPVISARVSPKVEISPSVDNTEPNAGDEINLTIIYKNIGEKAIKDAVLKIILPDEVEYVSANPSYNSKEENVLKFNLGKVDANTQGSVSVKVKIKKSADKGASLVFSAVLDYTDSDGKFQAIDAFLTVVVKEDLSLLALSLAALANLLKKWWFDLLLGLAAGLAIYHFFIKKEPETKKLPT